MLIHRRLLTSGRAHGGAVLEVISPVLVGDTLVSSGAETSPVREGQIKRVYLKRA